MAETCNRALNVLSIKIVNHQGKSVTLQKVLNTHYLWDNLEILIEILKIGQCQFCLNDKDCPGGGFCQVKYVKTNHLAAMI